MRCVCLNWGGVSVYAGRTLLALCVSAFLTFGLTAEAEANARHCSNLQNQLASLSKRGQSRDYARYAKAAKRQQSEINKMQRRFKAANCRFGLSGQCSGMKKSIIKMQRNLAKLNAARDRASGGSKSAIRKVRARMQAAGCGRKIIATSKRSASNKGRIVKARSTDRRRKKITLGTGLNFNGTGYRTMCVRLCDGYFFPVAFSPGEVDVARDTVACSAMCPGTPTQLFMHKVPDEESEDMVNAAGQRYVDMPTAFAYLKPRNASTANTCRCGAANPTQQTLIPEGALQNGFDVPQGINVPSPLLRPALHADPETAQNHATGLTLEKITTMLSAVGIGELVKTAENQSIRVVLPEFLPDPEEAIDLRALAPKTGL